MSKKLTHLIAVCLSFLMMATVLPNIRFGKTSIPVAYAEEMSRTYSNYLSDEDDDENLDYHDALDAEDDLRYAELIEELFPEEKVQIYDFDEDTAWTRFKASTSAIVMEEELTYDCTFNPTNMTFNFIISNDIGIEEENETINALVSGYNGELYGIIEIDEDARYNFADYKDDTKLGDLLEEIINSKGEEVIVPFSTPASDSENHVTVENEVSTISLFGRILFRVIAIVIVVYVIVAETAEQIRAKKNYEANKNRNFSSEEYITNQLDTSVANYDFGFTKFGEVGCEVVAVYNLMMSLGRPERLEDVIYDFERWAIEFSVGWGHLGSNPREIYRYLRKKNIEYRRYTKLQYEKFCSMSENEGDKKDFIFSRWNTPITEGLHTFYVEKRDGTFYSMNNYDSDFYKEHGDRDEYYGSMSEFSEGLQFICGYIIKTERI